MNEAQYNWEVNESPVFTTDTNGENVKIKNYKALTRSDDDKLLGVVGQSYKPMPNHVFADLVNELANDTPCELKNYGEHENGKRLYAKLTHPNMRDFKMSAVGDEVASSIVLSNGHAGSSAFRMFIEYMRLICLNGLTVPVKSNLIYARHTKNMEHTIGDITTGVDYILGSHQENKVAMRKLTIDLPKGFSVDGWFSNFYNYEKKARPIKTKNKSGQFVTSGWTDPKYSTKAFNNLNDLANAYIHSAAVGTYWGILNAVTYYVDHMQSNKPQGYSELGNGNVVKMRAYHNLCRLAQA